MRAYQPMTNGVREQLALRIKNGVDCSDFIDPYEIKGEDLSRIRCERFDRTGQDLKGTNFSGAWLPHAKLIQANCEECNFHSANLERGDGTYGNFQRANFTNANCGYAIWRYADLRGATLCGTVMRFDCADSYGARLSREFINQLLQHWRVEGVKEL